MADKRDLNAKKREQWKRLVGFGEHMTERRGRGETIPQWQCKRLNIRSSTWGNTVACCARCQQRKGGRSMHEAGIRFFNPNYEPKMPRTNYLVMTSSIRPEWRQYIRL